MKKDLNNSVIYKIFCKNEEVKDLYIGQTTDFTRRKYSHKQNCTKQLYEYNRNKNAFLYNTINQNGGWDNWKMEILEKYPCENREELLNRETFWIIELNATLNSQISRKTTKEKKHEWYLKHREIICEKQKEYNDAIKELYTINFDNLEDNPQWFRNNVLNRRI